MLPISREVLISELEAAHKYVEKWLAKVQEGIPAIDLPVSGNDEEQLEGFLREMVGELRVVSSKCMTISEILSETQIG